MTAAPLRRSDAIAAPAAGHVEGALPEVLAGLWSTPKTLPPKLFYDAAGAELFERICNLDEYYLTRTELGILQRHVKEIAAFAGPDCALIEFGSGAAVKVRLLLDNLHRPVSYTPVDISREQLSAVAGDIAAEYPDVRVLPVWGDYTRPFALPSLPGGARRLAFFPGSTIGNFHPHEAAAFLRRVRAVLGAGGALVLGIDRRKDAAILCPAYDDRAGVTAAFNLNVLHRLNREFDARFDVSRFAHRAVWNSLPSRIEMHIESLHEQAVPVCGKTVRFARGETIWTESSYKYDLPMVERLFQSGGFTCEAMWTDSRDLFWVAALRVSG